MLDLNCRFQKTKNFKFTQKDEKATEIFAKIQQQTKNSMPSNIYSSFMLTHMKLMQKTKLFQLMRSIPKGVLHHCHIDCCEDKQYYKKYIINDPTIYLTKDKTLFKISTAQQAQKNELISMKDLRKTFNSDQDMVDYISNITMFNQQQYFKIGNKQIGFWQPFQRKIINFFSIYYSLKHFKLYIRHVFQKYLKNGYDRLEWRALLVKLSQYDQNGKLVKVHDQKMFTQAIDEVYQSLKKQYPSFTIGVVFFGLLEWSQQQNQRVYTQVCQIAWDKTIGIDVVQQQKPSLEPYIATMKKVLNKYPHLNYKLVLHAGDTKDFTNNNVQLAVKAGSLRIGHGSNLIQRLQFLPYCKDVCFQVCPVSGVITQNRDDIRIGQGPILMSLGIPISLSPDDPGKFGYQDSTVDFFMSMISYNWSLKDLKLLGIYSINYAICSQEEKSRLLASFEQKWRKWVDKQLLNL